MACIFYCLPYVFSKKACRVSRNEYAARYMRISGCESRVFLTRLYFQENLFAVKDVEEKPAGGNPRQFFCHAAEIFWRKVYAAVKQLVLYAVEKAEPLRHVDCYGIETYNHEKFRPSVPASDVYDVIEQGEHYERLACHGACEGA